MRCRAQPRSRCWLPRLHGTALFQLVACVCYCCCFVCFSSLGSGLGWKGRVGQVGRMVVCLLTGQTLQGFCWESGQGPSVLDCSSLFVLSWGVGSIGLCNSWQASPNPVMAWILMVLFRTKTGLVPFCFFLGMGFEARPWTSCSLLLVTPGPPLIPSPSSPSWQLVEPLSSCTWSPGSVVQ